MTTVTPQNRDLYIAEYAKVLQCDANAFAIAATVIRDNKAYVQACLFILNLSARDPEQLAYAKKAAAYLEEYVGESYKDLTSEWLYEFANNYVTDVDTGYRW